MFIPSQVPEPSSKKPLYVDCKTCTTPSRTQNLKTGGCDRLWIPFNWRKETAGTQLRRAGTQNFTARRAIRTDTLPDQGPNLTYQK